MPAQPGDSDNRTEDALVRVWPELLAFAEGDHVHLDELLPDAPPAGSERWVEPLEALVEQLADRGGIWFVLLRLGFANDAPDLSDITVAAAIKDAARFTDADTEDLYVLSEQPAVYRGSAATHPERWEGVEHRRSRLVEPGVRQLISYARQEASIELNEPYDVSVAWQIHTPGSSP